MTYAETVRHIGLGAPLLWLALIAWGDLYRSDIDIVTDYISELGERGSSTAGIVRGAGFLLTGFLYVVLAAALPAILPGRWRAAVVAPFLALDGNTWRSSAGGRRAVSSVTWSTSARARKSLDSNGRGAPQEIARFGPWRSVAICVGNSFLLD